MKNTFKYPLILFVCLFNFLTPIFSSSVMATPFHLHISKEINQSRLVGEWKVVTEVVWSDCPYVKEGQVSSSKLVISNASGRLYPSWKANDWKLVRNHKINFSNDELITWERENEVRRAGQVWKVESIDKFELKGAESMRGESLLRQYLDGEFVGTYMTVSYLQKV